MVSGTGYAQPIWAFMSDTITISTMALHLSLFCFIFYLDDFRTQTVAFELSIDRHLIQHGLEDLTLLMHIYSATLGILYLDKGLVICNIGGKKERFERGSHALWSELESADATCDLHTIGPVLQYFTQGIVVTVLSE
ncbi:hypothetical protein CEK26_008079 [Fusarium fujikuroi]|nr:hypothetical protein CEK27_008098 [Fusarium fujikuroi]QGI81394.1 hypothetical protein CEK25_008123 [Fusarium fujikuroi]QGI95010.1 hypothetical protein CEK26_008079 [Fusarium fujikuroi]VTT65935.1 unnamed protein product [Fusarium fujikuroi]VZI20074.1 unnamed protein product [Fusarium fujikuroi]